MSELLHQDFIAAQERLDAAITLSHFSIVSALNLTPKREGNMWFILWGENIQEGVAGFGETPYKAVVNFNDAMNESLKTPTPLNNTQNKER